MLTKRQRDDSDSIDINPYKKQKIYDENLNIFPFSTLICGYQNTFCIDYKNHVYSFGINRNCMLGHNGKDKSCKITKILSLSNIKMISCGFTHSVCCDYIGNVYTFGCNKYGKLGTGNSDKLFKETSIPQHISIPFIQYISCGRDFTMCISIDNKLYSFGRNYNGELGIGNNINQHSPKQVLKIDNVQFVECSVESTICITSNSNIYSWGNNNYGQLGHFNDKSCKIPIKCDNWPHNIIDIKSSYEHTLVLTLLGEVYSFGNNFTGQLGLTDIGTSNTITGPTLIKELPEIQKICVGDHHSLCIDINNNLWVFGYNFNGQLGIGDNEHRYKPIKHTLLNNISDISSGGNHTFVKTLDNKIYAFGNNSNLQLGNKIITNKQITPIQVFENNESIWYTNMKHKQKSARK